MMAMSTVRCPHPLARRPGCGGPTPGCALVSRPILPVSTTRRRCVAARSSKGSGDDRPLEGIVAVGTKLIDQAAGLVPDSVPRPLAKGGIALAAGLFVFGMVQQVISGFVTLVVMGGVAYYFFTRSGSGDDDDTPKRGGGGSDDLNDPLSDVKRIMDKYK